MVDLGGGGELTAQLHRRLEAAETLNGHGSPAMGTERGPPAAASSSSWATSPGSRRELGRGLSNAALHWLPDQAGLLGRLVACLSPGGQLAVQMPANHDHPPTSSPPRSPGPSRSGALGGYRRESPVREPEWCMSCSTASAWPTSIRLGVPAPAGRPRPGGRVGEGHPALTTGPACRRSCSRSSWPLRRRLLPRLEDSRPYRYPFKRLLFWGRRP